MTQSAQPPTPARDRDGRPTSRRDRVLRVAREELEPLHPLVTLGSVLAGLIPDHAGNRVRTAILRKMGWKIGKRSLLAGVPRLCGTGAILERLTIGDDALINVGCFFELRDTITIGDKVSIGHDVMFLTSSHQIGPRVRRAGATTTGPVIVESGSWVGARSVVLPGVTIGPGAVVAAGAVVSKNVMANTLVAGAPAEVVVKRLPN